MQQKVRSVAMTLNSLQRTHRIMLGTLTLCTLSVAIWWPQFHHHSNRASQDASGIDSNRSSSSLLYPDDSEPVDQSTSELDKDLPRDEIDQTAPGLHEYVVSSGDTLSNVLNQYGIDMSEIAALVESDKDLRDLQPGQQLSWTTNAEGELQSLSWQMSRREIRTYQQSGNTFKSSTQILRGQWTNKLLRGEVRDSFVVSALKAGLSNGEISQVSRALQWQLDFRKLRKGDHFTALISREMLNGKKQQSQLIGVRLHTGGKDYYAFRSRDGKFYDRRGNGLAPGFLRFPTAVQHRVSSPFNPRRLNPVTGRISPHKGVDFAMPLGTPVLSIGDGEVVVAQHSGSAGNYLTIRHGRQYTTRYMHLKKLLVKPGQKVRRGQRIALSGNTGRSTGPHLHFEIWINSQAVNPVTAKLPRLEGLTGKNRRIFLAEVARTAPQLTLN